MRYMPKLYNYPLWIQSLLDTPTNVTILLILTILKGKHVCLCNQARFDRVYKRLITPYLHILTSLNLFLNQNLVVFSYMFVTITSSTLERNSQIFHLLRKSMDPFCKFISLASPSLRSIPSKTLENDSMHVFKKIIFTSNK